MYLYVLACIVMQVKLVVGVESRRSSDKYANMDCSQFALFFVERVHQCLPFMEIQLFFKGKCFL